MWCVFVSKQGAYCKYLSFAEITPVNCSGLIEYGERLYCMFPFESEAKRFTELLNVVVW